MSKILTCEHLTKAYGKEKTALNGIDLNLDFGRIVGLLLTTLIERITRKKLNPKYEAWINGVGMVLLLLLIAVITFKDIFHLFT